MLQYSGSNAQKDATPKALAVKKIFDYFDTRYRADMLGKPTDQSGPVITISRLTGCDAGDNRARCIG